MPGLGLALEANARRSLKAVSSFGHAALRGLGVRRFATEMIDVDTLLEDGPREGVSIQRSTLEGPPRALRTLALSDEFPPLRGVQTTISLLNISDPSFALRNGYLVDGQQRIIYEKNVVPSFTSLRIAHEALERPERTSAAI